jgi:hypothetical protein
MNSHFMTTLLLLGHYRALLGTVVGIGKFRYIRWQLKPN